MTSLELYDVLREGQEKRGYLFNKDMAHTLEVLDGLLINKERYGYMSCPCRLALGEYEADRDIICPCDYREEDVKEFGCCFCNLYVSKEANDKDENMRVIPERRPLEKQGW